MAFDPDINKIVLFGGTGPSWPPYNETWLFDGATWTKGPAAPNGLLGRTGAGMVYDPDIHRIVMVGGSGVTPFADAWLFDGSTWSQATTPPNMAPRQFFGMTYDAVSHDVVVAGGSGYADTWMFDGTSWSPGPDLPGGEKERFQLTFDPQVGGDIYFSGLGPNQADTQMWMLKSGQWLRILDWGSNGWPEDRIDGGLVWNPQEDSLMLFGGILDDFNGGQTGLTDTWFFEDQPPQVSSVTLSPTAPDMDTAVSMALGSQQGGYGPIQCERRWLLNGQVIQGENGFKLYPGPYRPTDQLQAQVRLTDALNLVGPWVTSDPITVADRAPSLRKVRIKPATPNPTTTLKAQPGRITDADGDQVTVHYAWFVNGVPAGTDSNKLAPSNFATGDHVTVVATPADSYGTPGKQVTSPAVKVEWNIIAGGGPPGTNLPYVKGSGFGPTEPVDIRLDAPTGQLLTTVSTDGSGAFTTGVPLPTPLTGGPHMFYGVGETSGIVGQGPFTVIPDGTLNPAAVVAGDTTTFTGVGFVPQETVDVSFPGSDPVQAVADVTGTAVATLTAPPEPAPDGRVTAAAPSGTATPKYTTKPGIDTVDQCAPYATVAVTITGFAPSEPVDASLDGGSPLMTFTTDASGSASGTMVMATTFGSHSLTMKGRTSGIVKVKPKIDMPATMTLSPTSGPVGTAVLITSGPGWSPGRIVHLKWLAGTWIADLTADGTGTVTYVWVVPQHGAGDVNVSLADDFLKLKASTTFTVVK
jgi:hypothetical protein